MTPHKYYRKIADERKNIATNKTEGFTLIEILIVIGIIAVLAGIVIIAINPAKQFAQARDTQRQSNIETILNAIGQRMADNMGTFDGTFGSYTCPQLPTPGSGTSTIYASQNGGSTANTGGDASPVDLSCLVPTYIASFPVDPVSASGDRTGYTLNVLSTGRITVCAPAAANELSIPNSKSICVTR